MTDWQPIATAPKSTAVETPTGLHITGVYLLGFIPGDLHDADSDPQTGISVIWWEPRGGPRRRGAWVNDVTCIGDDQVHPTHWMPLPTAPAIEKQEQAAA